MYRYRHVSVFSFEPTSTSYACPLLTREYQLITYHRLGLEKACYQFAHVYSHRILKSKPGPWFVDASTEAQTVGRGGKHF